MTTRQIEHEMERTAQAAREVAVALGDAADAARRTALAALDTARVAADDTVHAAIGLVDLAVARMEGRSEAEFLRGGAHDPIAERLHDSHDRLSTRGRRVMTRMRRRMEERRAEGAGARHDRPAARERISHAFDEMRDRGEEAVHRVTEVLDDARHHGEAVFAGVADGLAVEVEERIHQAHVRYEDRTVEELHRLASERHVPGRSSMTKAELIDALRN